MSRLFELSAPFFSVTPGSDRIWDFDAWVCTFSLAQRGGHRANHVSHPHPSLTRFAPPVKADPYCEGPSVTLAYNPKVCIVDESRKQIICTPASITIEKTPGVCVKKMITPAVFTGKSCSISKTVGTEVEVDIGNTPFVIDLDKYFPGTDPLKELEWNKKVDKLQKFHPEPPKAEPSPPPPVEAPAPAPEPAASEVLT